MSLTTPTAVEEQSAKEQQQTSSSDTENKEQQQPSESSLNNELPANPSKDDNQTAAAASGNLLPQHFQMEKTATTPVSKASKTISTPPQSSIEDPTSTDVSKTATDQTSARLSSATTITLSQKITVTLKAVGDAPILKQKNWSIETSRTMAYVAQFLRQVLKLDMGQSLFVFVNQCFAPSAEHTIGTLTQCFGNAEAGKLVLHYSTTQAWG